VEIQGIKGLWNLLVPTPTSSSSPEPCLTYLVQSYTWETRALVLGNPTESSAEDVSEMSEIEIDGFDHSLPTLFCGNLAGGHLVQVTPTSVRLVSATSLALTHEYRCCPDLTTNPTGKIFQATGNAMQLALALSGGEVVLLDLDLERAELVFANRLTFEQDIACLCLKTDELLPLGEESLFAHGGAKVDLLVVGLWTDHSVRIHALPSMEEVCRVVLGGEETAQARNVVLAPLSTLAEKSDGMESKESELPSRPSLNLHLLVGLGDGTLVTYLLSFLAAGLPTISNKQEIRLGTHPVSLTCFLNKGTLCVFAGCDQPTILFSRPTNDQLLYSPVNIGSEDVTCVSPFFHPSFSDCLALASDSALILGSFDSLQRVHITSCPLGEAPRHITHHKTSSTLAG
jgi:DNA damage-binding protein 1